MTIYHLIAAYGLLCAGFCVGYVFCALLTREKPDASGITDPTGE